MRKLILLASIFGVCLTNAQSSKNVEDHQITINVLFPGVSYEHGLSINKTLRVDAGVSIGAISFNDSGFDLYPRLDAQFRNYYNLGRRVSMNKNISGNSGNFYGLHSYYTSDIALLGSNFEADLTNNVLFGPASFETFYVGGTYGMQRSYASGFNWGLQLGLGVISIDYSESNSSITVTEQFSVYPNLRVTFGWIITNKKLK
jgi:hypothetical protein